MISSKTTVDLLAELNLLDECDSIEAKEISGDDTGKSIYETICAFSNEPGLGGGIILLGVKREDGQLFPLYKVTGLKNPDKLQSDIVSACQSKFSIPVRPKIRREILGGKAVLRIEIEELQAAQKPLVIKNLGLPRGALRRVGSSDVHCTFEDMAAFIQEGTNKTYDAHLVADSRMEDIDPDVIKNYRRFIAEFRPSSDILTLSDKDLMISTMSLKPLDEKTRATATGILTFGKVTSLRRFFPQIRADYIRVPGKEWITDPTNRFVSVDLRAPIISLIDRVIAAIADDLPRRFQIDQSSSRRIEVPIIPHKAIREAVVNSLLHRNYKVARPIQIIRYSNRLVIENPGHSLKSQDQFDNPGSITRNPHIAAILHETHFAETKGTGMRVMRQELRQAGLSVPTFRSDRENDLFRVTFLFHHLLGKAEWEWLGKYRELKLTEDQMIALVYIRETGEISNQILRDLTGLDAYKTTLSLRKLREGGLLEKRGGGTTTHYIASARLLNDLSGEASLQGTLQGNLQGSLQGSDATSAEAKLPKKLRSELLHLRMGKRAAAEKVAALLVDVCRHGEFSKEQLSTMINRDPTYTAQTYITPLVRDGRLEMTNKESPSHPDQKYRTPQQ